MIKKLVAIAIAFIAIGLPCVARADGPASRPAADADAPVARKSKVMIERIEVIGPAGSDWIGRAVEQGITAGISQESSHKFTAKGERVGRIATLDDLQKAGVDFLVRGVCQVADDQIRIDGSVSRVGTDINDGIGTFRIEGNTRDLFSTEDALSEKIVKMMAAANDAKNKDASPANHPATQPAAAATPVTLPDLGSNRFSGVDVPRYFDGDLSEILNPPARFQDEAHRYFNGQPVYTLFRIPATSIRRSSAVDISGDLSVDRLAISSRPLGRIDGHVTFPGRICMTPRGWRKPYSGFTSSAISLIA